MLQRRQPNDADTSSFGRRLEGLLVLLFPSVAIVAYLLRFWPSTPGAVAAPREVFGPLPVLIATTFGAISLGSVAVVEWWRRRVDERQWLVWLYPGGITVLYALGTAIGGHFRLPDVAWLAIFASLPVVFGLCRALWADWAMALAAGLPIILNFFELPNLPMPHAPQQVQVHPLFVACTGFWAVLVVRRLDGFQFRLAFGNKDWHLGLPLFLGFAAVALPAATLTGFGDWSRAFSLHHDWGLPALVVYPLVPLGMYFYPALVEEALFRGVLQNLLAKTLRNDWVALGLAAMVFGVSHYKPPRHDGAINVWFVDYAVFATLAGAIYGYAYLRTKRIMPGAIAHALVNSLWLTLFNPITR